MLEIKKHLSLLGLKVRDRITGFTGVISTVGFDLYGCIQAIVTPEYDKEKKELKQGTWFDINRLEILNKTPVMQIPDFYYGEVAKGNKGSAEKPAYYKN